jgi:lipid-A-disaccharide synthase
MKKLFVVAGEVSGDTHGAGLMRSLLRDSDSEGVGGAPAFELSGLGGPEMAGLSAGIENWLDEAAVLGLWEVLRKYPYFRRKMEDTVTRIAAIKPDGVVLIDYPGFNLRLADRLRREGYGGKLIYYISPQVWAWKKGRISHMAKILDLMICIFPFEKDLYENSGLKTVFAGHPLVDKLGPEQGDGPRDGKLVALLPGSREREIDALFAAMVGAARRLSEKQSDLRFAAAAPSAKLVDRMRGIAEQGGMGKIEIEQGGAHRLMRTAVAGVVASGTATLEAAVFGLPYCLVYRVAWPTYLAGRMLVDVDFLGIVNILAGREVVKELLQGDACAGRIFEELDHLVNDEGKRTALERELAAVAGRLGVGGAYEKAAQEVGDELGVGDEGDEHG